MKMLLLGLVVALFGVASWIRPGVLYHSLRWLGAVEEINGDMPGAAAALRILQAPPWITLFGVLLIVAGYVASRMQTRRIVVCRRRR